MCENSNIKNVRVCVIGAGLAGSMMSILLGKLGYRVSVYEKREDPKAVRYSNLFFIILIISYIISYFISYFLFFFFFFFSSSFNLFEQNDLLNDEFGPVTSPSKRSINLALSYRGILALKEVNYLFYFIFCDFQLIFINLILFCRLVFQIKLWFMLYQCLVELFIILVVVYHNNHMEIK